MTAEEVLDGLGPYERRGLVFFDQAHTLHEVPPNVKKSLFMRELIAHGPYGSPTLTDLGREVLDLIGDD